MQRALFFIVLALFLDAGPGLPDDVPPNLVLDVRLFEARSVSPDYRVLDNLSFFIDTDGSDVSEQQWLATVARKVPDSYLATLASQTLEVEGQTARLVLDKRSRRFEMDFDLRGFLPRGTFEAAVRCDLTRLTRGGDVQRSFARTIELRAGQTFVWSSRELELSPSEYLSHFRDYIDGEHRRALYERLRDFGVSLIIAITPRVSEDAKSEPPVSLSLPPGVDLPQLESPWDTPLVGTVELALEIGEDGAPETVRILRSSLPEVNPRLIGEARRWRFPSAAGKTGILTLELRAEP